MNSSPTALLRAHVVLAAVPFAFGHPAAWSASHEDLEQVVVTATRSPQALPSVLADVSVVDRTDIERSGAVGVADLLARLPGIEFARNGGPGTSTSVFIRGSEARHTAVYIDGVRIDSQATGGAVWEQIPLDQIDRIEVLRGPAAAIYGSDAVAGVVQLFTRRAEGTAMRTAALTAGTYNTAQVEAAVSGTADALDYSLSVSSGRSDGFNARTVPTSNPDDDGWRRGSVLARLGWQAAPQHHVDVTLLATRLRAQYDASLANDDLARHHLSLGSLGWQGRWNEHASSRVQLSESRSTYETRPSFYRTETTLHNAVLQHEQRIGAQQVSVVLERREDRLHNPATASASALDGMRTQDGVAIGWRGDVGEHGVQIQARHDDDSEFGGKHTGSLGWGWRFAPHWRMTASASTSFRAPTLYQRFSEYGTISLVPESGRNVELGVGWTTHGQALSLNIWRNKVSNLINFGAAGSCRSSLGCYENVGRARYDGVTLAGRVAWEGLALDGSVDWHDPRNLNTDKLIARRTRRLVKLGVDTKQDGWLLRAEVLAAGERFDNAANTQRLGGYALINVVASRTLHTGMTIEGRIDNLGDRRYELARTYATAGRTAQLSLRWSMQ